MRRVIQFCHWKATWWQQQARRRVNSTEPGSPSSVSPELNEGILAYAAEQEAMENALATSFEGKWATVRATARREVEGLPDLPNTLLGTDMVVHVNLDLDNGEDVDDDDAEEEDN